MPNYWRKRVAGGSYFFTVVTANRMPWLTTELGRTALRGAIETVQIRNPFTLDAIVLLPDHLHAIWTLPPGDDRYSIRWSRIKELTTRAYLAGSGVEATRSLSRRRKRERGVWQRRYWEHAIEGDDDFKRCLDYLHWNPVKHGLVERVCDYEYSTFNKYVQLGEYDLDWGSGEIRDIAGAEWE